MGRATPGLVLARNPNYWQQGMPYLDGWSSGRCPTPRAGTPRSQNGDVDIVFGGYNQELVRACSNPKLRRVLRARQRRRVPVLQLRQGAVQRPQDARGDHPLDRSERTGGEPVQRPARAGEEPVRRGQPVPHAGGLATSGRSSTGARPSSSSTSTAPRAATRTSRSRRPRRRVPFGEYIQAQMAAVGHQHRGADLRPRAVLLRGACRATTSSSPAGSGLRHAVPGGARDSCSTGGNGNYGDYSNPQVDALLDEAASTTDEAERTSLPAGRAAGRPGPLDRLGSAAVTCPRSPNPRSRASTATSRDMFFATTWLDR